MNDKKEFAFPSNANENIKEGMTKREYFAAKAMQGMLANPNTFGGKDILMKECVQFADAILKALANER